MMKKYTAAAFWVFFFLSACGGEASVDPSVEPEADEGGEVTETDGGDVNDIDGGSDVDDADGGVGRPPETDGGSGTEPVNDADAGVELCEGCCESAESDCLPIEVCRWTMANRTENEPGACIGAEGLSYTIALSELQICEFKQDNSTWDISGGAPDAIVELVVNGVVVQSSDEASDTFNPDRVEFTQELNTTDNVKLKIADVDTFEDDFIAEICLGNGCDSAIGIDALRDTLFMLGGCDTTNLSTLSVVVYPTPN